MTPPDTRAPTRQSKPLSVGRQLLLSTVSESEFQRWIMQEARRRGWRIHSFHDSRTEHWGADSGWPDLFLVRGERAIAAEVKATKGMLKPNQSEWLLTLSSVPGIEIHVWRPADEQQILEALA